MANVILPNEQRRNEMQRIMKSYGVDRNDPEMREAAEVASARTNEAIRKAEIRRRYY